MTPKQEMIAALEEKIQRKERACARCGDEWLQRNLRSDITALRERLRHLKGEDDQ